MSSPEKRLSCAEGPPVPDGFPLFSRVASFIALLLLWVAGASSAQARDAFVMLSGGHSPFDNNYSQYLQARAVVTWMDRNHPRDSLWVFFGAGNVEGERPIFCDVRREVQREGLTQDAWLPGVLAHNRPARRDVLLRALREEILPAVAGGGTLYLFVGDHGSQGGTNAESVIDLWGLERDAENERGWRTTRNETLGVTELRQTLVKGMGKGRVIFCMTQCHSGGFHYLAVPRAMTPNAKWFTSIPDWAAAKKEQTSFARIAGFTATDERSLAAGCQPDPDPERWAGYERFIPEQLFGMNLFTLEQSVKGLRSFAEAHLSATLVDQTIDKPYSTSEQYLERWASLIDTRLARSTNLTDKLKKAVAAYQRTVDGTTSKEPNFAFRERQSTFRRFTQRLAEQNPSLKDLVLEGTRKDLEQAIGTTTRRGGTTNSPRTQTQTQGTNQSPRTTTTNTNAANTNAIRRAAATNAPSETVKLWKETLRPAWTAALQSNELDKIVGQAREFEEYLLSREEKGGDFFSSVTRGRLQEEAFWRSGYSTPEILDNRKAEAVIRWGMTRRAKIVAWARTSDDAEVREAAEKLNQRSRRTNAPPVQAGTNQTARPSQAGATARGISRRVAAERALFYRRVLGAWEFLLAVNERPALARVRELTDLERTPLPPGKKR